MEFSAMPAEEYGLINITLISCISGLTNKSQQQNIPSAALTLISCSQG